MAFAACEHSHSTAEARGLTSICLSITRGRRRSPLWSAAPASPPARIVVTDYSGGIDKVIIPLVNWLSIYEPDLRPDEAVRFDAE